MIVQLKNGVVMRDCSGKVCLCVPPVPCVPPFYINLYRDGIFATRLQQLYYYHWNSLDIAAGSPDLQYSTTVYNSGWEFYYGGNAYVVILAPCNPVNLFYHGVGIDTGHTFALIS